jgi:hypothetical protein
MTKKKLGEILIAAGVIDDIQLQSALSQQKKSGKRLGSTLIEMKFLSEDTLAKALSSQLNLPSANPLSLHIPDDVLNAVPYEIVTKYHIIPLAVEKAETGKSTLKIAMADPTNLAAIDDIQFKTGCKIKVYVSPISIIEKSIGHFYPKDLPAAPSEPMPVPKPAEAPKKDVNEQLARINAEMKALVKVLIKREVLSQEEYYNELGKELKK